MQRAADSCRILIESQPNSGSWNMAVDEVLLESALHRGECSLRFYRWEQATISLGYFQSANDAAANPEFANLPVVRRLSGGGAILHHHELTYSCALPAEHPLAQSPGRLYELVHARLIDVLGRHGVVAAMRGNAQPGQDAIFLCFGRGDPRDIVCQGHKIVGSAQRRRRGAVLQHGSILLARSPYAEAYPGLMDFCPSCPASEDLTRDFAQEIVGSLALRGVFSELNNAEQESAVVLQEGKYGFVNWAREREGHRQGRKGLIETSG